MVVRSFPNGETSVRTPGKIEAAICEFISRFEQEYMGRGPMDIVAMTFLRSHKVATVIQLHSPSAEFTFQVISSRQSPELRKTTTITPIPPPISSKYARQKFSWTFPLPHEYALLVADPPRPTYILSRRQEANFTGQGASAFSLHKHPK